MIGTVTGAVIGTVTGALELEPCRDILEELDPLKTMVVTPVVGLPSSPMEVIGETTAVSEVPSVVIVVV